MSMVKTDISKPDVTSTFSMKINNQIPILDPQWAKIKDSYMISPIYGGNGRVLVQEDPFKSKYDCTKCDGKKHLGVKCTYCDGTKYDKGREDRGRCRDCEVLTELGMRSLGFVPCDQCKGQGGLIVTPEDSQKNATTGNVLAISNRDILEIKTGDKVIFTNYSGSPFKIAEVELRIIIERDLLGIVKMLKKGVDSMNEGTFADIANAGLVR